MLLHDVHFGTDITPMAAPESSIPTVPLITEYDHCFAGRTACQMAADTSTVRTNHRPEQSLHAFVVTCTHCVRITQFASWFGEDFSFSVGRQQVWPDES